MESRIRLAQGLGSRLSSQNLILRIARTAHHRNGRVPNFGSRLSFTSTLQGRRRKVDGSTFQGSFGCWFSKFDFVIYITDDQIDRGK